MTSQAAFRVSSRPRAVSSNRLVSPEELFDRTYDVRLIVLCEVVIEGQPEQAGTEVLGDGTLACPEFHSHRRQMQGNVVEHAQYPLLFQVRDQGLPAFQRGKD